MRLRFFTVPLHGGEDAAQELNQFLAFARLRALRKERAEAEGVPAYALFTNEQLADMVRRRVTSAAVLQDIPGIGEARVEKSAFAAPELTSGSEHPHLNRPAFMASPPTQGARRNATAAGVLAGGPGGTPNARRPVGAACA